MGEKALDIIAVIKIELTVLRTSSTQLIQNLTTINILK